MEGLLSSEDFEFLSRQPGFDMSLYRKFRRERLQIFHLYLVRMVADFNRLHTAAKLILSQSEQDQSELLNKLIWMKFRFSMAVLHAEFSYRLCQLGLRTLPVRGLLTEMETLSQVVMASAA